MTCVELTTRKQSRRNQMILFANIICLLGQDMFLSGEDVVSFGNDVLLFGNVMSLFVRVELHCPTGHMCLVILAGRR